MLGGAFAGSHLIERRENFVTRMPERTCVPAIEDCNVFNTNNLLSMYLKALTYGLLHRMWLLWKTENRYQYGATCFRKDKIVFNNINYYEFRATAE